MLCSRLPHFITIDELAKQLNLQPETIRLAMKAEAIPYYRFSASVIRFDIEEIRSVLQARMREHALVKGKGPPKKSKPAAATTGQNYNAQSQRYHAGSRPSRIKTPQLAIRLFVELVAMGRALSGTHLRNIERQVVRDLRQVTARKLGVLV